MVKDARVIMIITIVCCRLVDEFHFFPMVSHSSQSRGSSSTSTEYICKVYSSNQCEKWKKREIRAIPARILKATIMIIYNFIPVFPLGLSAS